MQSNEHENIKWQWNNEDHIHKLFDRHDVNKDGQLSHNEIQQTLRLLRLPYTDSYVNDLMNTVDTDKNQSISYHEFRDYILAKYRELHELFQQFDTNKDGVIDRNEVEQMLVKLNMPHQMEDVERLLARIDTDKSGSIDFDEWSELLMMIPLANVDRVLRYWQEAAAFDLEDCVVAPPARVTSLKSALIHLSAGALSGAASRTGTAPFERLKILYQVQTTKPPSMLHGIKQMYQEGGIKGMWRGNGVNVAKIAPESAVRFYVYEAVKRHFGEADTHLTASQLFIAGSVAGCLSHIAFFPLEVLKTRISASHVPVGVTDLVRQISREEGRVLPFFRGMGVSLASTIPLAGVNLTLYEKAKNFLVKDTPGHEPGVLSLLAAGCISSTASQIMFYPMHTIKARLILQNHSGATTEAYKGAWDVISRTVKNEGARGLYKGFVPSLLKAVPAHCISFVVYEQGKMFFERKK
jgi:solute carrier family 25 phosphate transporter 23/24/25/41